MRRAALFVSLMLVLATATAAVAQPSIPRVGDQLVILFVGPTADFAADTPFHVEHGWIPFAGDGNDTLHLYDFQLFVNGDEVHGAREVTMDSGSFAQVRRIFNFQHGLPAGTYTFHGVWTGPTFPPDAPFEQVVEVTFHD